VPSTKPNACDGPATCAPCSCPPYSPELNPAEKIWWRIKRAFVNKTFPNLDELGDFIDLQIQALSTDEVVSICRFGYIKQASSLWPILNV
jgi:transposase